MRATLGEVRLIIANLLTEVRLLGDKAAMQDNVYRVYQLLTNFKGSTAHGYFIAVPIDLPMYGRTSAGYATTVGGVQGYITKTLGLNKDSKDDTAPYYHVTEDKALVVNHDDKTINLDVAERSQYMNRRGGKHGSKTGRSYTIPHANTAFDNVHELQKILKAIMNDDPQVTGDYRIVGSPNHEGTVGDVLGRKRPGDQIAKGTDTMVFYHGTSEKRLPNIKAKGLNPGNAPFIYVDLVPNYSEHNVYLAATVTDAENYATRAAVDDASKAVVLKVIVRDVTKITLDEDNANWLPVTGPDGEKTEIHFRHVGWRQWPNAQQIIQQYMALIVKSANNSGTVAYRGRIPAKDVSVHSSYKPASMKKDPEWSEYADARAKTMATYTAGEPKSKKRSK